MKLLEQCQKDGGPEQTEHGETLAALVAVLGKKNKEVMSPIAQSIRRRLLDEREK